MLQEMREGMRGGRRGNKDSLPGCFQAASLHTRMSWCDGQDSPEVSALPKRKHREYCNEKYEDFWGSRRNDKTSVGQVGVRRGKKGRGVVDESGRT